MLPQISTKTLENEKVIAEFKPASALHHIPYLFGFRNRLIISDKRVILVGVLPIFDKEIFYKDISDVFVSDGVLEITKKRVRPTGEDPVYDSFKAFISIAWLYEPDKVLSTINSFLPH